MCMQCVEQPQSTGSPKTDAFVEKMIGIINGSALALMTSIGHRTGLFDAMSKMAPATSTDIALEARLNERYVREWLGAMVTGGIVEFDAARGNYLLPPEHAAVLTRTSMLNIAVSTQWTAVLGAVEDEVVAAFEHGRGVPYSSYRNFHQVMAEESNQTVIAGLFEHILPLVPGLIERLERGIEVLDVGCGAGRALIEMAAAFPRSRFSGYDFSQQAIDAANTAAREPKVANIQFRARDVATMHEPARFDLVTAFDAIHDQARPAEVLENIRTALRQGGVFLMQDILAETRVEENMSNALAPFVYTISCMHCMSVSLAWNGAGLGAAWGKQKALEMLTNAGFSEVSVTTLPHDTMNYYYVARPKA